MTIDIVEDRGAAVPAGPVSAVSWAAILAGAAVAIAASLVLFALGSGLGLAAASPWQSAGSQVAAFTVMTGIWLIIMQWVSAALGGYITGRLRIRWIGTHEDEVFFRDTAHGLLTWALATVVVAALAIGAAGKAADTAGKATAYEADALFRTAAATDPGALAAGREEAFRVLTLGDASDADRNYLAILVAQRTGVSPAEAAQRVQVAVDRGKAAADKARKAASAFAIFTAISMLIGAFIASVSAALAGRLRDQHP